MDDSQPGPSGAGGSGQSAGFVYFSTPEQPKKQADNDGTSDFIAFSPSESPNRQNFFSPRGARFSPANYSSPYGNKRGNFTPRRNYYDRGNRGGFRGGGRRNNSFGNRNFNNSGSDNSSFNQSGPSPSTSYRSFNNSRGKGTVESYFHNTMLEAPWEKLEAKYKEKCQDVQNS